MYNAGMQYDPFQKRAIEAIDAGRSVLVSAPTGAGKTAIAEYAIDHAFARGEKVVYTAPIKALSNQKFRDFSGKYPDQVGLLTGDVTLNPQAPLLIMTTEIYRNQLFEDPERLANTRWVIFDEVHYLDDPERGTVWEEAMMFSPPQTGFVALSATAPNVEELAEWANKVLGRKIEVIVESHRPVPLVHLFQCQGQIFSDTHSLRKTGYLNMDRWAPEQRFERGGQRSRFKRQEWSKHLRAKPNRIDDLVKHLIEQKRLPCLYFAFGRKRTEELAWEVQKFDLLNQEEGFEIARLYDELCERFELKKEPSAHEMRRIIHRGVAFHHAGMLPTLKEVIERLFTSKLIKLIFTTETFAIGINMPAKSVAFDEMRKFDGKGFGFLRTRDYYQMAGRAGRRGMDKEGYVYARVNPHQVPYPELIRIVFGKPEPIESQFNSCYATLLNLYNQFGSRLMEIYPKSFHYFQSNKHNREKGAALIERKLALLMDLGHLKGDKVTEKGEFASWMYGYELILSEMLEDGFLETLNEVQLAALLVSLVFEPRRNQDCPKLSPQLHQLEKNAIRYAQKINARERHHKAWPPTRPPYMHLAPAIEAWLGGCRFHELGRHTEVDEGELIRHFRMVIQLLRQLKQAPRVSENMRRKAASAMKTINRDLVDAEKQLRNMEEEAPEAPPPSPEEPKAPTNLLQ
jgi:superfamily II RNA helicase